MYYSFKQIKSLVTILALAISFQLNAQQTQVDYHQVVITETLSNKKTKSTKLENAEARSFDFTAYISNNLDKKDFRIRGMHQTGSGRTYTNFDSKSYKDIECAQFCEKIESIEKQPYLGVGAVPMDDFEGVLIETVIKNSAAEAAGIQPGDVITNVEEFEISSGCDLTMAIHNHAVGEKISIRYVRNDEPEFLDATLAYRLKTMITYVPCCNNDATTEEVAAINIADDSVVLFPNPSYGVSQVIFKSTAKEEVTMTIADMSGKEIIRKSFGNFDGYLSETLDLTEYTQGMYFMTIYQNDKVYTEKIVLQRP